MFAEELDQRRQEYIKKRQPSPVDVEKRAARIKKDAARIWQKIAKIMLRQVADYAFCAFFIGRDTESGILYYCTYRSHNSSLIPWGTQSAPDRCYPLHRSAKYSSATIEAIAKIAQAEGLICRKKSKKHVQTSTLQVFASNNLDGYDIIYVPDRQEE